MRAGIAVGISSTAGAIFIFTDELRPLFEFPELATVPRLLPSSRNHIDSVATLLREMFMKNNQGFTQEQAIETTSKTEEPAARVLNDDELSSVTGGAVDESDNHKPA